MVLRLVPDCKVFECEQAAAAKDTLEKLATAEEKAKAAHEGLWMYGDPGSESEDEEPTRKPWGRR